MAPSSPAAGRVLVAIDTPDAEAAGALAAALDGLVGGLKLGLEFFVANGPGGVARLSMAGLPVFLDLKLHDIPNTVAGAVRSAAALYPRWLTVHAGGGPAMMRAAREAAEQAAGPRRPLLLAVTVLTSLSDEDLEAVGQRPPAADQVQRLARLAVDCGMDGLVCSPREVRALRQALGPKPLLVVPGIRPAGADAGDQKRTAGPAETLAAGADHLVIGRPITAADDPAAAARTIAAGIESA